MPPSAAMCDDVLRSITSGCSAACVLVQSDCESAGRGLLVEATAVSGVAPENQATSTTAAGAP